MTTTGEYYAYEESIESTEAESRVVSDQDYFDGFNDYEDHDPIFLRGLIEEIDEKGHEMLKKLFDKVETKDHHHHHRHHHHGDLIARALRETLHEFKEKPALEALEKFAGKINYSGEEEEEKDEMTIMDRDFGGDEEFRMERFKVKTVIGAGVVKEEPN